MLPGDAPKSLSQHYRTIPGRVVCVEAERRGGKKREEQKEAQRDGGEERSFEPLPLPLPSPPPDRAGAVN